MISIEQVKILMTRLKQIKLSMNQIEKQIKSRELKKYEYLTGEYLEYKPGAIQKKSLRILHLVNSLMKN